MLPRVLSLSVLRALIQNEGEPHRPRANAHGREALSMLRLLAIVRLLHLPTEPPRDGAQSAQGVTSPRQGQGHGP